MAAVYKAYHASMERYVALKILPRQLANDPQFIGRFKQEAKLLAQLQHAHILPVFDYGEADNFTYIVMPLIKGGTLARLLHGQPLPLKQILNILTQVGSALDYAHASGLVHRDVKPSNVLIDESGNCLLTDFGVAKIVEGAAKLTGTGGILGTPAYMAPEQGRGGKIDHRSDLYSLGVMLYEMATGRVPYDAETPVAIIFKHIQDPLPLPRSINPSLPESVELVILKSLSKNPEDRYATAGEMAKALEKAIAGATIVAEAPPTQVEEPKTEIKTLPHPKRSTGLPPMAVAAAILLALLFIGSGIIVWLGRENIFQAVNLAAVTMPSTSPAPTFTPSIVITRVPSPMPTSAPSPQPTATSVDGVQLRQCGDDGDDLCLGNKILMLSKTHSQNRGASWSPDGKRIVFSACLKQEEKLAFCNDLFIVNRDDANITPLLRSPSNDAVPMWSPDGKWIAFHQDGNLSLIQPDGKNVRPMSSGQNFCPYGIAWSPDSQHIAWLAGPCEEYPNAVWVIDRDGTRLTALTLIGAVRWSMEILQNIAWQPDGKAILAKAESGEIYQIDIALCASKPNGCDAKSFTKVKELPASWLPTYYPPWGGALVQPTLPPPKPAHPAQSFAEPILKAIADRRPDFSDDFSNPTSGWDVGSSSNDRGENIGKRGYVSGEYFIESMPNTGLGASYGTGLVYSDFVAEMDARFIFGVGQAMWGFNFRQPTFLTNRYEIKVGVEGGGMMLTVVKPSQTVFLAQVAAPLRPEGQANHLFVIAKGSTIAVYMNGEPVIFARDETHTRGGMSLFTGSNDPSVGARVHFDNFKIWDISKLP